MLPKGRCPRTRTPTHGRGPCSARIRARYGRASRLGHARAQPRSRGRPPYERQRRVQLRPHRRPPWLSPRHSLLPSQHRPWPPRSRWPRPLSRPPRELGLGSSRSEPRSKLATLFHLRRGRWPSPGGLPAPEPKNLVGPVRKQWFQCPSCSRSRRPSGPRWSPCLSPTSLGALALLQPWSNARWCLLHQAESVGNGPPAEVTGTPPTPWWGPGCWPMLLDPRGWAGAAGAR